MIELEGVPELVDPVMVAAFEGWNDAGDAASTAVGHMEREWKGEVFAALDAEDYYDFQVNRPQVWLDGGSRKITWPTTRLAVVRVDDAGGKGRPRDLVLVRGIEPSMRWRSFCNEILGFAHELGVEMVVVLGALLGDTPHSRPVPVTGVTSDPDLARTMGLEESRYEGPTGIVGILQEACTHAGVPAVSLWASVPHYVSQPPNPKATLALLNRLEDLLKLNVPLGELQEDARAWQLGVDQLAAEDSEVAEYVQSLEEARDTAELPEASGEAIAKEFERYLRRRDDGPGTAPGGPGGPGGPGSGRSRPPRQPARENARDDKKDKDKGKGKDAGEDGADGKQAEPDADGEDRSGQHGESKGGSGDAGTPEPGTDDADGKPEKKPVKRAAKRAAKPAKRTGTTRGSSKSTSKGTKGTPGAKTPRSSTSGGSRGSKPAKDDGGSKDDGAKSAKDGEEKPETSSDEGHGPTGEGSESSETGNNSRTGRSTRNSKNGGTGKGRKKKTDDEAPGEE